MIKDRTGERKQEFCGRGHAQCRCRPALASDLVTRFTVLVEPLTHDSAWEKLLDGRFDSKHPGRTLWRLFDDQRGKVFAAVALYIIKADAGGYFLLLLQNPLCLVFTNSSAIGNPLRGAEKKSAPDHSGAP